MSADTPAVSNGESEVNLELIAKIWRDHTDCMWTVENAEVGPIWSCGIIHQQTTRDRHMAALVMTQIEADRVLVAAALPALIAEVERQALESIDSAHVSGDPIALAEAKMRWWWAESERHRRSRDSYRLAVAQARRWVETCVDPVMVGPMRKQAMLDYLDGLRGVPDFEVIPQHPVANSSADLDAEDATLDGVG